MFNITLKTITRKGFYLEYCDFFDIYIYILPIINFIIYIYSLNRKKIFTKKKINKRQSYLNRHRWICKKYKGKQVNSIEGTRQINSVTSEEGVSINLDVIK